MAKKQMNYCINCGEEINGAKFCPKCGTKQDIGTFNTNTNDNTNNNTITVNVNSNTENEKASLSLDELIQKAQTELEAKDFDALKQTAKEIQTNFPKNFYGWYFEALCIMQSPIDGTLGKLAKGLTIFSNALVESTVKSDKQREATEVKGAGGQALGVLTMETFQARIFKAIKCISGNEEARARQESLAFGLLSSLINKVWKMYQHKSYVSMFGGEKSNILREYETKLNSFIINLYNAVIESSSADSIAYKKFMGNMYGQYSHGLGGFKYKISLWKHPTRNQTREILEQYKDYSSIPPKKIISTKDAVLRIVYIFFIISVAITLFITIGNAVNSEPLPYPYPYY